MRYSDGITVRIKDKIWVNEGADVALVAEILESEIEIDKWGVEEPGIMVCFGSSAAEITADAFIALEQFQSEGIGLVEIENRVNEGSKD
jgi:hypothetical protein